MIAYPPLMLTPLPLAEGGNAKPLSRRGGGGVGVGATDIDERGASYVPANVTIVLMVFMVISRSSSGDW